MEFLPIRPRLLSRTWVRGASGNFPAEPGSPHDTGSAHAHGVGRRKFMKRLLSAVLAGALLFTAAPASYPEPQKVAAGTDVRPHIINEMGPPAPRSGVPFFAVVPEPVFAGNTLLIPAGTRVHGTIGTVEPARRFSIFRGQAYMDLTFRSLEIDSRLIPVHMSILDVVRPGGDREAPR